MTPEVKMNHNLKDLTESLRIGLVVFIENDFKPINDIDPILSTIINFTDKDIQLMSSELTEKGYGKFAGLLAEFIPSFNGLKQSDESNAVIALGKMAHALSLVADSAECSKLHGEMAALLPDEKLERILFKYGIGSTPDPYNPIFEQLKELKVKIPIRYYEQVVAAEIEEFTADISAAISGTTNTSYLCIVDKMLGEDKNEGLRFVNDFLPGISSKTSTTPISFIFSSQPDPEGPLNCIEDYFQRQIDKNSDSVSDEVTLKLAQCAYARIFEKFESVYVSSAKAAAHLVIKNHKNINHILVKAQNEGLTPFEAIFNWFQSALDMNVQKKLTTDYTATFGLTQFFGSSYLPSYQNDEAVDKELLELNTFEIFDYDVNKKHLSIGSGDVFFKDGKYYVLVGQECDLLIREADNKRNDRVIELLDAKFEPSKNNEKLTFRYDDSNKTISIENFIDINGNRGSLKITSLTNHKLSSPELLDLCMYNSDGKCKIVLTEGLEEQMKHILPKGKDLYYEKIKAKIQAVHDLQEASPGIASQVQLTDFSNFDYAKTDIQNELDFGFVRLCRIKGSFRYFINKTFYEFRGRIDLNLVNNTEEPFSLKNLSIRLKSIKEVDINNARVYHADGKYFIKVNEIIDKLPAELVPSVSTLPGNRINLVTGDHYEFIDGDPGIINLSFIKSFNGVVKPIKGYKVSMKSLLGGAKAIESNEFQFLDDETTEAVFEADGTTYKEFEIDLFIRKVKIVHNGTKHIYIQEGKLIIEDFNEAAATAPVEIKEGPLPSAAAQKIDTTKETE